MNSRKKYERIRDVMGYALLGMMLVLAIGGMGVAINGDKSVIYDNFHAIVICLCVMCSLVIPLAISSEKAFKLEVDDVKKMDVDTFNDWINKTDEQRVRRVLNKIGGYEQKWVKSGEDK